MTDRQLVILRHGKAESGAGKDDFDRLLQPRGETDSQRIGAWLRDSAFVPDDILSSPAARARQTAEIVADSCGVGAGIIRHDRRLYLAPTTTLLTVLRGAPAEAARVMIVGHNPGLEDLLRTLVGLTQLAEHGSGAMPTASAAVIDFTGGWEKLKPGIGRLAAFMSPSLLAESI